MIFSLDVRRARKGDCLLLHYGSRDAPGLIVIDGGPAGVYGPHLKPRIEQIRSARGLARQQPLDVDLLMVSHVDDDHINGLLELTGDMIEDQRARRPPFLRVLSFWHNSFDNIIDNDPDVLAGAMTSRFGAASAGGGLPGEATIDVEDPDLDESTVLAGLKVLASIRQGAQLRADADRLELPLSPELETELILAAEEPVEIADGLTFTVAGPMVPELKKLQRKHDAWLKSLEREGKTPEDVLSAYLDKSVPNLSSLVVLAEADGRRMLLTGDARGDRILEGLELVGALEPGGAMHVELLKVPHHGSANNVETGFFERITADHYVLSGNGEHGNPERATLEMLWDARGDADYLVHLTYPVDEIDVARRKDWAIEQGKEKKRQQKNPSLTVRPNWSRKRHSLASFLEQQPQLAAKIEIVPAETAHVIDLGDPLGDAWPSLA